MAAGSARWNGGFAELDTDRLDVAINGTTVFTAGAPTGRVPDMAGPSCAIDLELGLGEGRACYLASDLTYDYVRINADYTT
jgi:glutamate N-acetyltransferase/amino-acid N-acetyltransferase